MLRKIIFGLLVVVTMNAEGQDVLTPCFTDEGTAELMKNPEYAKQFAEKEAFIAENLEIGAKSQVNYIIPVVVHILHVGGTENITDAQVIDMIRVQNEDYNRTNADTTNTRSVFTSVASTINVEFRLAKKDENGNCTNGIIRHYTPMTKSFPNNFKEVVSWDNNMYLNLFIVDRIYHLTNNSILGYARFPVTGTMSAIEDGVVVRHFTVGTVGTAGMSPYTVYDLGRTVTHEFGHFLNLYHPFQGSSCFGLGDGCSDTPASSSPSFGCNPNKNTCGSGPNDLPDQIENFMEYSDDDCENMFTVCQRSRVQATLANNNLRGMLSTASNLQNTGVLGSLTPDCKPGADAYPNRRVICAGGSIKYTENNYDGDFTSLTWNLPGSNVSAGTDIVNVTYDTPGTYDFGLSATNSKGTGTVTFEKQIVVLSDVGKNISGGYLEDFDQSLPAGEWNIQHTEMRGYFRLTTQASFSGSSSYWINNFAQTSQTHTSGVQSRDEEILYMPAIDMLSLGPATLRFQYSYCKRGAIGDDRLLVQISANCGSTWITRSTINTSQLKTAPNKTTAFFPSQQSQWSEGFVNLASYASLDHLLIRFVFESKGGNNFFIDDVSLQSNTFDIEELSVTSFEAYPNPFNDNLTIKLESSSFQRGNLVVTDLQGKEILSHNLQFEFGINEFKLNSASWAKGIYLVRIEGNFGNQAIKLIKK